MDELKTIHISACNISLSFSRFQRKDDEAARRVYTMWTGQSCFLLDAPFRIITQDFSFFLFFPHFPFITHRPSILIQTL